jgi:tRNA (Thr-GGU) A37 N-methylase
MFTSRPIGFVSSPYKEGSQVPKGLGNKHDADGVLNILPEFELGLTDIEGFSHLFVIWEFDRSQGFELMGTPPATIVGTACLQPALRTVQTRLL